LATTRHFSKLFTHDRPYQYYALGQLLQLGLSIGVPCKIGRHLQGRTEQTIPVILCIEAMKYVVTTI